MVSKAICILDYKGIITSIFGDTLDRHVRYGRDIFNYSDGDITLIIFTASDYLDFHDGNKNLGFKQYFIKQRHFGNKLISYLFQVRKILKNRLEHNYGVQSYIDKKLRFEFLQKMNDDLLFLANYGLCYLDALNSDDLIVPCMPQQQPPPQPPQQQPEQPKDEK